MGLPAIYLDSWKSLNDYSEKDLNQEYEHLLTFDLDMIYFEYWKNQIKSKLL